MRTNCTLSFGAQGIIRVFIVLTLVVPFPSQVYAVSVQQFSGFADNIEAERFILDDQELEITGELTSPGLGVACIIGAIIILCSATPAGGGDPQEAFLLNNVEVNGTNIVDQLLTEATSAQNVVFERELQSFLGGSKFIGTSAFSGNALDEQGNIVSNTSIGFGVFETDSLGRFFTPITFGERASDFESIVSLDWDLSPVLPDSATGSYKAVGLHLQAFESAPSPTTLPLILIGAVSLVVYNRFCRKRTG